jgi:hypothetical protein
MYKVEKWRSVVQKLLLALMVLKKKQDHNPKSDGQQNVPQSLDTGESIAAVLPIVERMEVVGFQGFEIVWEAGRFV